MTNREIDEAIAFIERNLKSEFSLADIADHIGYSPFHFAREFRMQTGMSVMSFARNMKLQGASKEIVDGRGILDVALDYGFGTHAGFTKAFTTTAVDGLRYVCVATTHSIQLDFPYALFTLFVPIL